MVMHRERTYFPDAPFCHHSPFCTPTTRMDRLSEHHKCSGNGQVICWKSDSNTSAYVGSCGADEALFLSGLKAQKQPVQAMRARPDGQAGKLNTPLCDEIESSLAAAVRVRARLDAWARC